MPRRDPQTGQYVSGSISGEVETVTWTTAISIPASQLDGLTDSFYGEEQRFEGVLLYDLDQVVNRHEVGELVTASHRAVLQPTGTQTADSAAFLHAEISASPGKSQFEGTLAPFADASGDFNGDVLVDWDDSADLVGRPLSVMAQGPFTDGTAGLGGAGSPGEDTVEASPLGFDMDRRDELYLNGRIGAQNIADGPVTAIVSGQHVYSIEEP